MPRFGGGSARRPRDPSISRIITPAPLSNVTGRLEFDPSLFPLLFQNGYSRATAFRTNLFKRIHGLTVAVYSSLFDRSKSKRMDLKEKREREKHIYSWWVPRSCPNRHVTSGYPVLLRCYRLPIRISSASPSHSSRTSPIRISPRSLLFGSVSQMTCCGRIMGYVRGINYTIHG